MPLPATFDIPIRLPMADQVEVSHINGEY
jgi:hypothetical protein